MSLYEAGEVKLLILSLLANVRVGLTRMRNMALPIRYMYCSDCGTSSYGAKSYVQVEVNEEGEIIRVAPGAILKPVEYGLEKDKETDEYVNIKKPESVLCAVCLSTHRLFSFEGPTLPDACKKREEHKMYHVTNALCPCESK